MVIQIASCIGTKVDLCPQSTCSLLNKCEEGLNDLLVFIHQSARQSAYPYFHPYTVSYNQCMLTLL